MVEMPVMKSWMKLLVALLLVAFASSTIVQVAQATAMDVKMALAVDGDGGGGCKDCPSGANGGSANCMTGCAFHVFGLHNNFAGPVTGPVSQVPNPLALRSPFGWLAPPDPYPPRTYLLS